VPILLCILEALQVCSQPLVDSICSRVWQAYRSNHLPHSFLTIFTAILLTSLPALSHSLLLTPEVQLCIALLD
jgi:hypothetical protein